MLLDSGVGVSTKTTFMCRCGLVVKFNLVNWFRDWLTSPWWTGFWPRLVLRKGVKFSSLSFFYLPFDIWLGFSPCGKDWIHAMTVSFMKKNSYYFGMDTSLKKIGSKILEKFSIFDLHWFWTTNLILIVKHQDNSVRLIGPLVCGLIHFTATILFHELCHALGWVLLLERSLLFSWAKRFSSSA